MHRLSSPSSDPTFIFELYRGSYGSELLNAAVSHFGVFRLLAQKPLNFEDLRQALKLEQRPAIVLITALRAMQLLQTNASGQFELTIAAAEHLVDGGEFDVGNYLGLSATSPGVLEIVERLRTNRPAGLDGGGAAFIYRDGMKSAMEQRNLAEHFTLALSGRAKNVAPVLADRISMQGAKTLLDVGAGTGIYSIAFLRANPSLTAIALDRPEVLKTALQFATEYGVHERLQMCAADMFVDPFPSADVILLSNILHDWDIPDCRALINRCAAALNPGGKLIIHDVLLNDDLDGPLSIALYSASLFSFTEGRAYSLAEYKGWLSEAGLIPEPPVETLVHCFAIPATRN
ncbi:MAG: methyltransferase domain-containing protein [Planctomycetaceae bacterium]|nr:methyltransferase domain-containing protein [Planctomycetaceae bacterium]